MILLLLACSESKTTAFVVDGPITSSDPCEDGYGRASDGNCYPIIVDGDVEDDAGGDDSGGDDTGTGTETIVETWTPYEHVCANGSTGSYQFAFPVQIIGHDEPPSMAIFLEYDPVYVEEYTRVTGLETPAYAWLTLISLNYNGYVLGSCSWLDGSWYVGFYTKTLTLYVLE